MAFDSTKILAGRDFKVFTAAFNASNALPLDVVDPGSDWGAPWGDKGLIEGGLHMTFQITWLDVRVDQLMDPVLKLPDGRTLTMAANIAQYTTVNLQQAMGLPATAIATVAASTGVRGHDDLVIDGSNPSPQFISIGFEMKHPGDGQAIRLAAWRCLVGGTPTVSMVQNKSVPIAYNLTALPDTSTTPARIAILRDISAAL